MKILFMGTPDFAVPCLEELYKSNHEVCAVVTQPDKPKGRGKKVLPPPIKTKALEFGLEIHQPKKVKEKEFIDKISKLSPDCIVVVAYGQILSKDILNIPPKGCINVHASLLPKYRGAAPINWAIINGEKETGITTMYMNEGLDTGDMILKDKVEITDDMNAGNLHDKLSLMGANLLIETLDLIDQGKAPRTPQDDSKSCYAKMLRKEMGLINWDTCANEIHNLIRGLNPWPVAYTMYKNKKLKIWESEVIDEECTGIPGEILKVNRNGIYVSTKSKLLLIKEIQFPNNRKMKVDEYIRGNSIKIGQVLGD